MKELLKFFLPMPVLTGLLAALMLLAAACTSPDEPEPAPAPSDALRTVCQLSVSGGSVKESRASGYLGEGYDTGLGFENYIDIPNANFRFYYFDSTDDKFLAELEVESIAPLETTAYSKTYSVQGKTPTVVENHSVKIVVLANWPKYPDASFLKAGVTTIADFWNFTYDFNKDSMRLSDSVLVPLFGITESKTVIYDREGVANVGTVHLLRAYAKVEVVPGDSNVYPIEQVKLRRYNTRGFCTARVSKKSDYVKDSYNKDYTTEPWIPAGYESSDDLDFMKTTEGTWLAYVPEYRNLTADGQPRPDGERSTIEIRFADYSATETTEFKDYTLEFAWYNTSVIPNEPYEYYNIMRNNWYRYTVNKQKYTLNVEVDVIPYKALNLDPVFGVEPTYDMPEELYIVGNIDGKTFSPDRGIKLTREPISKSFYGDVELNGPFWFAAGLNTELEPDRFYSHGNQYGMRYGGTISYDYGVYISPLDNPQPISLSGNTSEGYYKVVVRWESMQVFLYEANPAMPDELYIVGGLGGQSFSPDRGIKLTRDPDNEVFYGDIEITGEFWFAAALNTPEEGSSTDGTFYTHYNQFGPSANALLTEERTLPINVYDIPGHFYFSDYPAGMKYHVVVDWDTMKVSADSVSN